MKLTRAGSFAPDAPALVLTGAGKVASHFLTLLLTNGYPGDVIVATRDSAPRSQLALAAYAATAVTGELPRLRTIAVDLRDVPRTAELLAAIHPGVIVHAATLYPSTVIRRLPDAVRQDLEAAGIGAFLSCHLALLLNVLDAIAMAGIRADVVNCAYPDGANPAVGRRPGVRLLGAGNIGNNVSALQLATAELLDADPRHIGVRMVMHHSASHRIHRLGHSGGAPYLLRILHCGLDVTKEVDTDRLFNLLATRYARGGGASGTVMAAASAVAIVNAARGSAPRLLHMPGPGALPGGYPVRLSRSYFEVSLSGIGSIDDARRVNEQAQRFDGIEQIVPGDRANLTAAAADVLKATLGFRERVVELAGCHHLADDLVERCRAVAGMAASGEPS